jgi:NADH:ubiquinone oxidoreductase subunit 6 (subunit J)
MPSFLTSLIGMLAVTLNNKFLWNLEPEKLVASVGLTINFVIVTLGSDIAKMKRGEKPNWNSTKLVTLLVACLLIGFTDYVGIELSDEDIWWISGIAASFITVKGARDIVANKREAARNETPITTQSYK